MKHKENEGAIQMSISPGGMRIPSACKPGRMGGGRNIICGIPVEKKKQLFISLSLKTNQEQLFIILII